MKWLMFGISRFFRFIVGLFGKKRDAHTHWYKPIYDAVRNVSIGRHDVAVAHRRESRGVYSVNGGRGRSGVPAARRAARRRRNIKLHPHCRRRGS